MSKEIDKKYDHKSSELELKELWASEQTYSPENNPGELFSIDTPPPTVSGSLHIGHIFSYTQTDIIARYTRMNGYSVFYPFGFDDNGLPTEKYIEKKLKIRGSDLPRSEFINLCLKETVSIEEKFKQLWQSIGLSANWDYTYSTISKDSRKLSQESFIKLFQDNYIYRKLEPAIYCTACRTSVAQAELEDQESNTSFNDIVFKLEDDTNTKLVISTTRPELLSSCVAIFYHPNDPKYKNLKNKKAIVPIFNNKVEIFADELVDPDKGTGLVMCCTFGDKNDIEWYKKFNLPYKKSIGFSGRWEESTGPLAGLKAIDARKKILELLDQENLLVSQKQISHAVNTHERCKKPIEYIVIPQWFIKILDYKKEFLELAEQINWYPKFMYARYKDWVENLGWDWCISRQRFYGIPFPVWHCNNCSKILLANIEDLPIDPQETNYKNSKTNNKCPECNSDKITPDTDVMDTWNTSSITPEICLALWDKDLNKNNQIFSKDNTNKFLPMSMRPQAHDIIRTWAFDTIVKSYMHYKTIPWENIVISGHVLSSNKEKLSKSKGNSKTSPEQLLEQYSADSIRYWTASGNLGSDIAFSENQLKIGNKLIVKLWNAFRFCSEHLSKIDFNLENLNNFNNNLENLEHTNKWILNQASKAESLYQKYFVKHEFSLALTGLEQFFWSDFCDNYLELIKDQLFNPENYSQEQVNNTLKTLYIVGFKLLQLYAPYVPYVTDKIYRQVYFKENLNNYKKSIHQTRFKDLKFNYSFENSALVTEKSIELISQIRKLKTENQLSLKTSLNNLNIIFNSNLDKNLLDQIKSNSLLIQGISQSDKINFEIKDLDSQNIKSELKQIDDNWHAIVVLN